MLITQRILEASKLIKIKFPDVIIIGKDNYYSSHQN
ncbi:MAG: hypothetical protein HDT40_09295 [Lachnospiraceae bacterium]|nr:hypothetical protein [Lachnospiraceae bacterium]